MNGIKMLRGMGAVALLICLLCVLPAAAEELNSDYEYQPETEYETGFVSPAAKPYSAVSNSRSSSLLSSIRGANRSDPYSARTPAPTPQPAYSRGSGYSSPYSVRTPASSPQPAYTRGSNYSSPYSTRTPAVSAQTGSVRGSGSYMNPARTPAPTPTPSAARPNGGSYADTLRRMELSSRYLSAGNRGVQPTIANTAAPGAASGQPAAVNPAQNIPKQNEEAPGETELDGLPTDNTLCLVGLGFQLNPDGSMQPELIGRLEMLKRAAEKYPQAIIVCTGGHTASNNSSVSEAGQMAEWLVRNGVDASRILVEGSSLTTQENAAYTLGLLEQSHPEVTSIAIVTSDYHMDTGVELFRNQSWLMGDRYTVTAGETYSTW